MPEIPAAQRPLDLGWEGGTSALFCPHYLPELHPEKNLDQLCREDFLFSPWLYQTGLSNPFVIARDQLRLLWDDPDVRRERLPWLAAFALLNRRSRAWEGDAIWAALRPGRYLRAEVVSQLLADRLLSLLPDSLTTTQVLPDRVPVDLRVLTNTSYDSAAPVERVLLSASRRGMRAVAVADRGRPDGAQLASRVAQRLKLEGKLPADFQVLPAQTIETTAGAVLALFTGDPIPNGMTLRRTVERVHRDGGLAYLLHPADPGASERLRKLDLDGYILQPGVFEAYRTGPLLSDRTLAGKPALAASNALYGDGAGLPFTMVAAPDASPVEVRAALARGEADAAAGLYLPWMTAASWGPVATLEGVLSRFFGVHRFAETHVARWIGADCLTLATTWDDEVRDMLGLSGLPRGLRDLWTGGSPLRRTPRLSSIGAEYGPWRIGYDDRTDTLFVGAVVDW